MLAAADEIAAEVERELESSISRRSRRARGSACSPRSRTSLFFPILYWIGFRETLVPDRRPGDLHRDHLGRARDRAAQPVLSGYIAIVGNLVMFALFGVDGEPGRIIGPAPRSSWSR